MAVPGPHVALPYSHAILIGALGLVVLFLGGVLLGIVLFEGLISAAWISVILTGIAMVLMALGAWFMWYGLSKAYPS
jgi:hypothetical protein